MNSPSRQHSILAIGGSDHDVNACVVRDGRVLVSIEEERISRLKYGLGGNLMAGLGREYVAQYAGLELNDFDEVVVDSILPPTACLGVRKRARPIDHHICHASSAYFTSGFPSAAILVVDNAGGLIEHDGVQGLQATTWYHARGHEIQPLGRVLSTNWKEGPSVGGLPYQRGDGDHSLGHFYKKITGALGFRFPHGAQPQDYYFPEDGITMGLAAYAPPLYVDHFLEFFEFLPEGRFKIWLNDGRFDGLLSKLIEGESANFERRAAVAASAQAALQRTLGHLIDHLLAVTGESRLCLAGGVAMNSSANGEILRRSDVKHLYVPPVPGDNGTALGAALWTAVRLAGGEVPSYSVYAGKTYEAREVEAAVQTIDSARYLVQSPGEAEMLPEVARLMHAGKVVAWFEGGSESGRRALGHRSILAPPQPADIRDYINAKVKHRQWFRPFAPVVPEEDAARYFEINQPSPYMQIVVRVRPEYRAALAAVTHVDGTARVQTVSEMQNPRLHGLLRAFEREAGIPVLLNTSFNGPGEPIVETPAEAVRSLGRMALDGLVLENWLVTPR